MNINFWGNVLTSCDREDSPGCKRMNNGYIHGRRDSNVKKQSEVLKGSRNLSDTSMNSQGI